MIRLLGALGVAVVVLGTAPGEAHRISTRSGPPPEGISIPSLTHGQMAVISDNLSAIRALAGARIGFDMTTWRLEDYLNLQSFACLWGGVPGSIADEESPFNECAHAYLAAGRALLLQLREARGVDHDAVEALIRKNGFMNPGGSNFWTYTTTNGVACPGGGTTSTYTLWHMIEPFGTNHTLPTTYKTDTAGCLSGSGFSGPVQDGSGIVVTANATGTVVTAADSSGTSLLSSSLTDAHGNTLSLASGTYTDSMGLTPIVVTGTAPAATFTWKDVSGFDQAVSIGVTQKTVQTAFACGAGHPTDVASFACVPADQYFVSG